MMFERRSLLAIGMFVLFGTVLVGCGGGSGGDATDQSTSTDQQQQQVSATGSLTVSATYPEDVEAEEEVNLSKFDGCGDETLTVSPIDKNDDDTLKWAVVSVKDGPAGLSKSSSSSAVVDQENCEYTPHVVTAKVGQTVEIKDSDANMHNVRAQNPDGSQLFNESTFKGQGLEKTFDSSGAFTLACDVHNWMSGYVYVTEHGQAAVTGDDGTASLSELPTGDYTISVWQQELGMVEKDVTIEEDQEASLDVEFTS